MAQLKCGIQKQFISDHSSAKHFQLLSSRVKQSITKEERCSFSAGSGTFPAFQCGLGQDPTAFITLVSRHSSLDFLGAVQTSCSPTHLPHLYLFVFFTRKNNCMHQIYFVCKLLSVGFQHCLTIAYSKTVYWHCLVAIMLKSCLLLSYRVMVVPLYI